MDDRLSQIDILYRQGRYKQAKEMLTTLVADDPNNSSVWAMMANIEFLEENFESAMSSIDMAINLTPNNPNYFYIKSNIALALRKADDAEKLVKISIEMNSENSAYFTHLSDIKFYKKDFEKALAFANIALELDPEDVDALNSRSSALIKLNRKEESFETIEGALHEDPNNDYTHANFGWGLLEKGSHKKALDHFKESLSINPNNEYAQAGMLEALKATNPVYRLFLKYSFWMQNQTKNNQWIFIIGIIFAQRFLRKLANSSEALKPFITPLLILIMIFVFSTWIITPISNLFLRFNTYGKFLLDKKEKMSSNLVAISLGICLIGLIGSFTSGNVGFTALGVYGFSMMVPYSVIFEESKYNGIMIYSVALAIIGLLAVVTCFSTGNLTNSFSTAYLVLLFIFQFAVNFLRSEKMY